MTQQTGISRGVLLLALLCAISFGAILTVAHATAYHVTCVGHGFEPGGSATDGSFFSRVDPGCSSTYRVCGLYSNGSFDGSQAAFDGSSICSAWSRDFGNFSECNSTAHVSDPGVFSDHTHLPDNYCG
jgi:hypothetical protein